MATQADPLNDFCWLKDDPIPPIDPADLKSIWAMQEQLERDFEKRYAESSSKPRFQCQHQLLQASMQPGKCRGSLVSVVDTRNAATCQRATGTSLPWPREGKPGDAVFKALVIVPMTGLAPGVVRKVPPFDPDALIRLIKQESEA